MSKDSTPTISKHVNESILENSIPAKMLGACVLSSVLGGTVMALTNHLILMSVFISILICVSITTPLFKKGKINITMACIAPMLILCFVYTPMSWFTFDGLLGCTPYLSILFITIITLTYYRKVQKILLICYGLTLLTLIVYWLAMYRDTVNKEQILNILVSYSITTLLIFIVIEGIKRKHTEINNNITDLSMRDDLTGLLNRRAIELVLGGLEGSRRKAGLDYAVVMMDIDKFKNINDVYGHNLGDAALQSIAKTIQDSVRIEDYAFRYGGDEFLLILPNSNREKAFQICSRVEAAFCDIQGFAFDLSISLGCCMRSEGTSVSSVFDLADKRMYEAKHSKKNYQLCKVF